MSLITKNYNIKKGLSAITVFNADTLNGIVSSMSGNIIDLPHNFADKIFEGLYYTTVLGNTTIVIPSPKFDLCVEAYGVPWRWSTFLGCNDPGTMKLSTLTHRPSTWSNVKCGQRYEKRWIKEPHIEPAPALTGSNVDCKKDYVTWSLNTVNWSVSTVLGPEDNSFPYILKYSQDGIAPYTFTVENDTLLNIQVCQDIKCEQVLNTLTIYTDRGSLGQVHNEIVNIVDEVIKPRVENYLTANSHPVIDIDTIVKILPINSSKRYFDSLTSSGLKSLSGDGTTNISFVFTDSPSAYTVSCSNSARTPVFDQDITNFKTLLSSSPTFDYYRATIFAVTHVNTLNMCPSFAQHLSGVSTNNYSGYPLPYNLSDTESQIIKYRPNVQYKGAGTPNTNATTKYYTDLILDSLLDHGIDLINLTPNIKRTTLCSTTSAVIGSAPYAKIYTANRFVLVNKKIKFQNLSVNIHKLLSITVDFGDNIIQTYTGANMYNDFYVTYTSAGYKTLNITTVTYGGYSRVQTFPNIVNIVNYYD